MQISSLITKQISKNILLGKLSDIKGGIAIPAILWMAGVPLTLVILLWLLFFRG